MEWADSESNFGFLLHDISRLLRKRFDRRARDLGLTKSQWIVMAHLARHEGIKQSGLAEILEIEPITLARHLDRLGETGWIERRADPADRRVWRLVRTDAGSDSPEVRDRRLSRWHLSHTRSYTYM